MDKNIVYITKNTPLKSIFQELSEDNFDWQKGIMKQIKAWAQEKSQFTKKLNH